MVKIVLLLRFKKVKVMMKLWMVMDSNSLMVLLKNRPLEITHSKMVISKNKTKLTKKMPSQKRSKMKMKKVKLTVRR